MSRVVIGVDLGGTNLRTALITSEGDILDKRKEATHASDGWGKIVKRLVQNIERQQEIAAQKGIAVAAVGVGSPGVIQVDKGIVVKSPNFPDWNNLPLKDELEKVLRLPVMIENDANAAALGEQWRGAGMGIGSMILLTLGTGVGGGIVLNKQIWHGADGMAGELGHMTIIPDGRKCGCGNTGCLEMYASARGIVQSYQDALGASEKGVRPEISSAQVYQEANKGNARAVKVMQDMGRILGIGIANLINIFNPEMVVIGGGVRDAWPLFIGSTRTEIRKRAFEVPAARTQILPSKLGDDAGTVGAAATALQRA
ncbi:MAG TPA: ROK family protein [Nitrospirota bacterium]|nr:ROK family protein [Nitrospirota bacterium]